MKKIFFLLFLMAHLLYGQGIHNNWYFGNHAALNFNNTTPSVLSNSAMNCTDMSASISWHNGRLLFYTDGVSVWDSTHQTMPNGTGLLGGYTGGQIATIVPHPRNTDSRGWHQYFIFTNTQFGGTDGFRYSVIDMNLNGGKGDIMLKNKLVFTPSSEKCTVVPNKNGIDYWIITHELQTDAFRVYPLTFYGLDTNSVVISHVGTSYGVNFSGYQAIGQLVASKKGDKLATALYDKNFLEIYDFNNSTGVVSNAQAVNGYNNTFGCEFSEDGTKLYFTQWQLNKNIYQVDLQNNLATTSIGTATSGHPNYGVGYLQLAPNGKIYFPKFNSSSLGCIQTPNVLGTACGFTDNAVNLQAGVSTAGLPNNFKYPSNNVAIETALMNTFAVEWLNPVKNEIIFTTQNAIEPNMEVTLYNLEGQSLANFGLSDFVGKHNVIIPISNLSSGLYFCTLKKNGSLLNTAKLFIMI